MVLSSQALVYQEGVGNNIYRRGITAPMPDSFKTPLEKIMKDRGVTQEALAQKIGVKQAQIQRYAAGIRRISPKRAKQMAEILECHWHELMDESSLKAVEDFLGSPARELAVAEFLHGMAEADRDAVFRHARALSKPATAAKVKRG